MLCVWHKWMPTALTRTPILCKVVVMHIEYLKAENLHAPEWHANYLLKVDQRQVEASLRDWGWLTPLVAQPDGTLIDGVYRAKLGQELGLEPIPVSLVDVDEIEARIMHIRLNRNRGLLVGKRLSLLIQDILHSGALDDDTLPARLGMTIDEYEALADGTLIKQRKIPDHKFSNAWVPFESSSGEDIRIERPTGKEEQISE